MPSIKLNVDAADHALMLAAAKSERMTLAAWCRRTLWQAAKPPAEPEKPKKPEANKYAGWRAKFMSAHDYLSEWFPHLVDDPRAIELFEADVRNAYDRGCKSPFGIDGLPKHERHLQIYAAQEARR